MEFFYSPCHKENLTDKKKNFKINLIKRINVIAKDKTIIKFIIKLKKT